MLEHYLRHILNARIYKAARQTPLDPMPQLSDRLQHHILLKREDLQPVFSFKIRGAYNKISKLSDAEKARGVIVASAGNHAQGVAFSAKLLNIKATVIMPVTTPDTKVIAVRNYGAEIILHGDNFDQALEHCLALQRTRNMVFISPYDDLDIIAGQGTMGLEILQQCNDPIDAIFVPVGGGGMIAGIIAVVKYLQPEIKVIGVEPEDAASLTAALKAKSRVKLEQVGIFADGVAVKQVGVEPFKIIEHHIDGVINVTTDEICAAIKDIFNDTRAITEPSGALAIAGVKKYVAQMSDQMPKQLAGKQTFIAINSGANTNFKRLRHITERAEIGEGKEVLLAATIPEQPGSFKRFCQLLDGYPITEFNYRYHHAAAAHIFVGIELKQRSELKQIMRLLASEEKSLDVLDMTDNEMAKIHLSHMIGGHMDSGLQLNRERVFRFEFPERPGALMQFLTNLGDQWNISLFHYRNHGSAYGRVLAGLQIPEQEQQAFALFLHQLGYPWFEETENPAYQRFLR